MSDEKPKEQPPEGGGSEEKEQKFVPADAYQSLQQKAAAEAKEKADLKAKLAQMEADQKAREEREMAEKQQFEDLWKKEKEEKEQIAQRMQKNDELYRESIKKSHLKDMLGGKIKDQYLDFADLSKIQLDDAGRPDSESLKQIADKFREDYPELIPRQEGPDIGNIPPGSGPGKSGINVEDVMNDRYAFHEMIKGVLGKKQ